MSERPQILVVEDDAEQADWFEERLRDSLKDVSIWRIASEHEVYRSGTRLRMTRPRLAIVDVLLPLATPDSVTAALPEGEAPPDPFGAGLRVAAWLKSPEILPDIHVVFYTVRNLERVNQQIQAMGLGTGTTLLPKGRGRTEDLIRIVSRVLKA